MDTKVNKDVKGFEWKGAKVLPLIVVCCFFLILWFYTPSTKDAVVLSEQGWKLLVIFLSTILSFIIAPLPMGAMAVIAATMCVLTNTIPLNQVLASFGSNIVWLIVSAFLLARGFIKSGLGARIAFYFIKFLGKSTLGLAYGLTLTELIFAPGTPSNTARGGGIVNPIIKGLSLEYSSLPEENTQRKISSFLYKLLYQINVITSAMFLTATAGNPLIVDILATHGIVLSWGVWALACIVPGCVNLIVVPLVLYVVYPPELKYTPEAPEFARKNLEKLGPMDFDQIVMLLVFILLLFLWVLGDLLKVDATTAGLTGLSLLLLTGVLNWKDIQKEEDAWNTFVWMSVLIMLSAKLAQYGVTKWFGFYILSLLSGVGWVYGLVFMGLLYYYAHYFFASMTAHISALYATFFTASLTLGAPTMLTALFLAVSSSLSAGLTYYGTGSGPVYFGSKCVSAKEWFLYGFIISVVNIVVWVVVGCTWWKVLGYW
jgi:DASS family divalent anion:Na+ symporter